MKPAPQPAVGRFYRVPHRLELFYQHRQQVAYEDAAGAVADGVTGLR